MPAERSPADRPEHEQDGDRPIAPLDSNGLAGSATPLSQRFPQPFPPPFASAWGDDEYGLWSDLEVASAGISETVTQRLRWIEPGTFRMGSPETEAERSTR